MLVSTQWPGLTVRVSTSGIGVGVGSAMMRAVCTTDARAPDAAVTTTAIWWLAVTQSSVTVSFPLGEAGCPG